MENWKTVYERLSELYRTVQNQGYQTREQQKEGFSLVSKINRGVVRCGFNVPNWSIVTSDFPVQEIADYQHA